jgi:hypothetical protein
VSQCTTSLKSSRQQSAFSELHRALIIKSLMWALFVVPPDPASYLLTCLRESLEVVLPDALLFKTSKELLYQAVLLWRAGRDVVLLQSIESARPSEPPALKDQPNDLVNALD